LGKLDDAEINYDGRLLISNRAHVLFEFHKAVDGILELRRAGENIGTTKKGIGPCYTSKATRNGIRFGEMLDWGHFKKKYMELAEYHENCFEMEHDKVGELEKLEYYRS